MKNDPIGIIHLNLKTKHRRDKPKSEQMELELARLERANANIKDEPAQSAFFERNLARIKVLQLRIVEQKKLEVAKTP
jgi:hypothetical protein